MLRSASDKLYVNVKSNSSMTSIRRNTSSHSNLNKLETSQHNTYTNVDILNSCTCLYKLKKHIQCFFHKNTLENQSKKDNEAEEWLISYDTKVLDSTGEVLGTNGMIRKSV